MAVAMGTTTLLQIGGFGRPQRGTFRSSFPVVEIRDWPDMPFRAVLIDTARKRVEIEDLKRRLDVIEKVFRSV